MKFYNIFDIYKAISNSSTGIPTVHKTFKME